MLVDCVIIGGGPSGLNAALVLGRATQNVILFDSNKPRNAVTQKSHGFITRDGIKPAEFRQIAHMEISRYPKVEYKNTEVISVIKNQMIFELVTPMGEKYQSKTIIISTGLKDILPSIDNISDFFGKSLFNCPYCDGWELKDKPLVVIVDEQKQGFHYTQIIYNWSKDLVVCTNGKIVHSTEQKELLQNKGIKIIELKIENFIGQNGQIEQLVFENGETVSRKGDFVLTQWIQSSDSGKELGCENNSLRGIATDSFGRINITGVYAAGDASFAPGQLIIAASEGSRAAVGVNMYLTQQEFLTS